MAETQKAKMSETLVKEQDKNTKKIDNESIDDSGIEMNEEKEKVDANQTMNCPWILGQLAWARGSSYPFWPCVVTLDPKTMQYHRVQNKGRSQVLMVHVQYFGDGGRHNWVLSHYMIPFSNLDDFHKQAKSIIPKFKKKDPKYAAAFSPKLGVKKQWGIGVTEASGLMHLSNEERASIFEPVLPVPEDTAQPTNNKLKRKLSTKGSKIPSDSPTPGPKKFKKIENEDQAATVEVSKLETDFSSSESTSAPEEELGKDIMTTSRRKSTRNQNKISKETTDVPKRIRKKVVKLSEEEKNRRDEIDFEDYYNLNKDFWKADYPDATDEEIKKLLRKMWDEMDSEEKSKNLNRNFDEYRYNSTTDQSEEAKKQTTSHQEKENSKNTENAQSENNKSEAKISVTNDEDSVRNDTVNEKAIEIPKINGSPQKDKSKEIRKINNNSQREKSDTDTEIKDDSLGNKRNENKDSEIKDSPQKVNMKQNGSSKETEEQKICKVCLKVEKSTPEALKNTTETVIRAAKEGEDDSQQKMEVMKAETTDKDKFLCTNCQKEKV